MIRLCIDRAESNYAFILRCMSADFVYNTMVMIMNDIILDYAIAIVVSSTKSLKHLNSLLTDWDYLISECDRCGVPKDTIDGMILIHNIHLKYRENKDYVNKSELELLFTKVRLMREFIKAINLIDNNNISDKIEYLSKRRNVSYDVQFKSMVSTLYSDGFIEEGTQVERNVYKS